MKKTKLYQVLLSFDSHELNKFSKFINSPYFNKNQQISAFFEILKNHLKNSKSNSLLKEELWSEVNKNERYEDVKFRKMCSDLLKLIERYFSQITFEQNKNLESEFTIRELANRKQTVMYPVAITRAEKLLDRSIEQSSDYFYNRYSLEKTKFSLSSDFEIKTKRNLQSINYETINKNLDAFYIIEKLKFFLSANTYKRIKNVDFHFDFIPQIEAFLEGADLTEMPALELYYLSYLAVTNEDDDKYYHKLKEKIFKQLSILPFNEANDIFGAARNFCIRKVNKGITHYHKEVLELYKYGLHNKILYEDGKLSPTFFRNIVIASIREEEYDWAENFITQYQKEIPSKYRTNAVTFNTARVAWYRKDFKKVLELLREVEYEDLMYNLNSKIMLLSVYYELDEYDTLFYFINSYKAFIRRNKGIKDSTKKNLLNFIKYITKLTNLNTKDRTILLQIKNEIINEKQVSSKKWLLEKIDEFLS